MRIPLRVQPGSKRERVTEVPGGEWRVCLSAPPRDGEANDALIRLLARYFSVPQANIRIILGRTSRRKLVEVRP